MKRNYILAVLCLLLTTNVHALIVSVDGYGEVPETGLEMTVNEAEEDPLSGKMTMGISGTLLTATPLTVTITRSSAELSDEFCCAGQCTAGNGDTSETLVFQPNGIANWYCHYTPAVGSNETVTYCFSDNQESRSIIVHYQYQEQGLEEIQDSNKCAKILQNGILYIIKDNKKYTIL